MLSTRLRLYYWMATGMKRKLIKRAPRKRRTPLDARMSPEASKQLENVIERAEEAVNSVKDAARQLISHLVEDHGLAENEAVLLACYSFDRVCRSLRFVDVPRFCGAIDLAPSFAHLDQLMEITTGVKKSGARA